MEQSALAHAAVHSPLLIAMRPTLLTSVLALTGRGAVQEEARCASDAMGDVSDQQAAPLSNKSGYYYAHNTVSVRSAAQRGAAVQAVCCSARARAAATAQGSIAGCFF